MDRNLLERTCDVRWWALESAFASNIKACDTLDQALSQIVEPLTKWSEDKSVIPPVTRALELAQGGAGQFAIFAVNAEAITLYRELSEHTACSSFGTDLPDSLHNLISIIGDFHKSSVFACDRLEDINSIYTLYLDLVITNKAGFIIGNANRDQHERVLGMNISEERWFTKALETRDGTEYHAQDLESSVVENVDQSLI